MNNSNGNSSEVFSKFWYQTITYREIKYSVNSIQVFLDVVS